MALDRFSFDTLEKDNQYRPYGSSIARPQNPLSRVQTERRDASSPDLAGFSFQNLTTQSTEDALRPTALPGTDPSQLPGMTPPQPAPLPGVESAPVNPTSQANFHVDTAMQPSATTAQQPGPSQTQYQTLRTYQDALERIQSAPDPQTAAIEQDRLARELYTSLQADGHDVKWQGDQIIIDGRPYTIAGAGSTTPTAAATATATGSADTLQPTALSATAAPAPTSTTAGYSAQRVDPNLTGSVEQATQYLQNEAMQILGRQLTQDELNRIAAEVGYPGGGALVTGAMYNQALGLVEAMRAVPPGTQPGGQDPNNPTVLPFTPGKYFPYQPGEIPLDDLQGFDMASMEGKLSPLLAGLGEGQMDQATRDLVLSILQNPESLSPQMVDTLKARSADELAEMSQFDEQELKRLGFAHGIEDSNWLASERLGMREDRKRNLIESNRNIDIAAAETNMRDRLNAAQLGSDVSAQQRRLNLEEAGMRKEALALAADTGLRQAALLGDRYALREQIAAKAAEMGLSADQMQLQYTLGLMDDLTTRYGIDVGKEIDLKRLAQQSQEFKEELSFKMAELAERARQFNESLAQADEQFGENLRLRYMDPEISWKPGDPYPDDDFYSGRG